ncbi:heavy-metal-associated domain-containing protein [Candidatus Woesearchaeota archaeon]|nr:heavy-metal-associated domain-containing protein [Candidatus Woesearchaeota archaeon]
MEKVPECCKKKNEKKGFLSGLMYGLLPHTGCIAFIFFTIFGVSAATAFFKPLLMNKYFFYGLIALSFVFASISAIIYLKRHNLLSVGGAKKKWKYLSVLYGTSIGVNLLLFMVIFPIAANVAVGAPEPSEGLSEITLKVDIPCPGHAPLITGELKKVDGVENVKFSFPNEFAVSYDSSKASADDILAPEVFNTYSAKIIAENTALESAGTEDNVPASSLGWGCGSASGSGCGCGR